MAGVIAKRLRLTTSRKPSYRRAGVKIGTVSAPTYLEQGDVTLEQALALVRDPNIALAFEDEEGGVQPLTSEERAEIEDGLMTALAQQPLTDPTGGDSGGEPDTSEPQGEGNAPEGGDADAEASKVSGMGAAPEASDGSAADAGTTEPSQPAAADPAPTEPAPAPAAPASKGTGKPKTVKGKS